MVAAANLVEAADLVEAMVKVVDLVEAMVEVVDLVEAMAAVDSDSAVKVRCNRLWCKSPNPNSHSCCPYLSGKCTYRYLVYS